MECTFPATTILSYVFYYRCPGLHWSGKSTTRMQNIVGHTSTLMARSFVAKPVGRALILRTAYHIQQCFFLSS